MANRARQLTRFCDLMPGDRFRVIRAGKVRRKVYVKVSGDTARAGKYEVLSGIYMTQMVEPVGQVGRRAAQ